MPRVIPPPASPAVIEELLAREFGATRVADIDADPEALTESEAIEMFRPWARSIFRVRERWGLKNQRLMLLRCECGEMFPVVAGVRGGLGNKKCPEGECKTPAKEAEVVYEYESESEQ